MALTPAPLFDEMAGVPTGGVSYWVQTSDDVRIRVGLWRPAHALLGTVLLFPGRTEYIEKYGDAADHLARRGFATLVIDWRGQGLADRLLDDVRLGHVTLFSDYQHDVDAALRVARELNLPEPFHLIGHSMGGAIGLRAVLQGLPVSSCAFTGPMWGIEMSAPLRLVAWALSHAAPIVGLGRLMPPGSSLQGYVRTQPFENNVLTQDREMYLMMQAHIEAHPELELGGPTLVWLREALKECSYLALQPSPDLPCLTFLGDREAIIDCGAVRHRMAGWAGGDLEIVPGARHEVLMEPLAVRERIFDRLATLFTTARSAAKIATTA